MIIAGFGLVMWAFAGQPGDAIASRAGIQLASTQAPAQSADAEAAPLTVPAEAGMAGDAPSATSTPSIQLPVSFGAGAPAGLIAAAESVVLTGAQVMTTTGAAPVRFDAVRTGGDPAYQVTFAAATRFDTIDTSLTFTDVRGAWASETITYTALAVLTDTLPSWNRCWATPGRLSPAMRPSTRSLQQRGRIGRRWPCCPLTSSSRASWSWRSMARIPWRMHPASTHSATRSSPTYLCILPGQPEAEAALVSEFLGALPSGNREPGELTVLAMTGVTAMCRMTAAQMDLFGPAWPAEIVGPGLASADITHISNEVPFVEGCETNTSQENYNFCSKPEYMETLIASGADIIGMTGNHQNDFGRQNAMASLEYYDEYSLPYYGGGKNLEEAMKPLFIEHNGTRLAFLGANSYGPKMAWATDSLPGAAPFDLNILSATIRSIKEKDLADVVLVELQYQESYDTEPLAEQRIDFNALVRAGADIVTGVQSHVPQGMEFSDESMILYGLGNLYFDQMGPTTREGMVARHTFYAGRHISTQIQTTVVYDYGQPHWTTPAERASMLRRVFAASYW
ncbi:MAG: CapA family protein [Caldilinea sp.]|nr:CapA family protein [Caldilinea sp.]